MREIRQSGSEGGGADQAALPTPIQGKNPSFPSSSINARFFSPPTVVRRIDIRGFLQKRGIARPSGNRLSPTPNQAIYGITPLPPVLAALR